MNKTVLIVEDESELREMLANALKTEGYRILEASNGQEAIDTLRQKQGHQPNMILMDLMMPGMDGWAFRSELLRDPLLSYIPIVVISGNSNVPRVAQSMRATAYLAKPFTIDDLVHTVQNHWLDDSLQKQHTQAVLETMTTTVHRLSNLIESLLQNAPIIEDRLLATSQPIDIQQLTHQLTDKYRQQALQNDTALHISIENNLTTLFTDPDLVTLILENLLENAVNTMNGGEIELSIYRDQTAQYIAVRNTGGSPQPIHPLPKITEKTPSITPNPARSTAPGVGLGLSLIREILASVNGHLELKTEPNSNTFTLVLPTPHKAQQAHVN